MAPALAAGVAAGLVALAVIGIRALRQSAHARSAAEERRLSAPFPAPRQRLDGLDPAAPRHGCDHIAATPVWYIPRHSIATRGAVTEEFYRIVAGFAGERQQRQLEGAAP
jgi:hypothetical protein